VICLYIDDMIIKGDEKLMEKTIESLEKVFKVKIQQDIKNCLGCEIVEGPVGMHLYQRRVIKKLIKSNEIN